MQRARHGNTVTVQYVGTLDNGRIFDGTTDEEPLEFTIGSNHVFPALEQAVIDMAVGEVKNILIPAAEAFGPRLHENVLTLARSSVPTGKDIVIGQKLGITFSSGHERIMLVTEVHESSITLDGNHPLAGLDLTFALRLDRIR